MKLEDEAGWMVLRFHHTDADAGWLTTIARTHRRVRRRRRPTHDRRSTTRPAPWSAPAAATGWFSPAPPTGMLLARPLGGREARNHRAAARIRRRRTPPVFDPPTVDDRGDASRARLLRDALRLSFRASGGPFRSFAQACRDAPQLPARAADDGGQTRTPPGC